MNFKIATPEKVVFKEEVDQITLPTIAGEITILPNHIPLVGVLKPGEIRIINGKEEKHLAVSGGFIEVLADKVVLLADTAERAEELDVERAEAARKRAEEALTQKRVDAKEFARLTAMIEKETVRIRVAKKHRMGIGSKGLGDKKYNQE
ncbi:TPA: F0F1 ATP synthase subunit epsilon [Candidatus Falkowbacteria bacterium]|nr:F0F1 ATP synthase subunit epsilon [Candidatus Falkowbacteria bacterium]